MAKLRLIVNFIIRKFNLIKSKAMKQLLAKIQAQIEEFNKDAEAQLVKGNKAAGTRARKAALNIGKLMKEFRKASVAAAKAPAKKK